MSKTFNGAYFKVVGAHVEGESLIVTFANGDTAKIGLNKIVPSRTRTRVDWAQAKPDEQGASVIVPAKPYEVEVQANMLRKISDREYANHVVQRAEEQARRIGVRLKELREARHLSQVSVARLAHLEQANLSRIENGYFDVSATTLWKILAAMDCSINDLVLPQDSPSRRGKGILTGI